MGPRSRPLRCSQAQAVLSHRLCSRMRFLQPCFCAGGGAAKGEAGGAAGAVCQRAQPADPGDGRRRHGRLDPVLPRRDAGAAGPAAGPPGLVAAACGCPAPRHRCSPGPLADTANSQQHCKLFVQAPAVPSPQLYKRFFLGVEDSCGQARVLLVPTATRNLSV